MMMRVKGMQAIFVITLFLCCLVQSICDFTVGATFEVNNRPIIGILAQDISYQLRGIYGQKPDSYVAASYVKFLESAGARAVPIWIGQNRDYYENILQEINGVILPGGASHFNSSKYNYERSAKHIYSIAKEFNKQGDYFPIFGVCLGFQVMTYFEAEVEFRESCTGLKNIALPLIFKEGYRKGRLFKNATDEIIRILTHENVTANFHKLCVTEKGLAKVNLTSIYRVLTINHDADGLEHVSSVEHFDFPFYGVQFHPEKNSFEWAERLKGIPHTRNAVKVGQYFANFFVNEARKNQHKFQSQKEEQANLIYNHKVTYSGLENSTFEQIYIFNSNESVNFVPRSSDDSGNNNASVYKPSTTLTLLTIFFVLHIALDFIKMSHFIH